MYHHDLLNPLRMWSERDLRLQSIIYYISGDKTGGLGLEEKMESEDLKITSLFLWPGMASRFPGSARGSW